MIIVKKYKNRKFYTPKAGFVTLEVLNTYIDKGMKFKILENEEDVTRSTVWDIVSLIGKNSKTNPLKVLKDIKNEKVNI